MSVLWPSLPGVTVTSGVLPSSPRSPFGPLMFPAGSQVLPFLTNTSPVCVFTNVSPSLPWFSFGSTFPFNTSLPSRPDAPAAPSCPSLTTVV